MVESALRVSKYIKEHFSNGRDFKNSPQELSRVAMLRDETVSQYAAQIRNLARRAKSCLDGTDREKPCDALFDAIDPKGCFLADLPPEIGTSD